MKVLTFRSEVEVSSAIPEAVEHLREGGLLGYPTETMYGLGSNLDSAALAALGRLKDRNAAKPFLLLVSGAEMAEQWGLTFNEKARALADVFWPGPLTLVLPASTNRLPDDLRSSEGGVAVRRTSQTGVERLIHEIDHPITSTSANPRGRAPAVDIAALCRDFGHVDALLALDGGPLEAAVPSTILDCMTEHPSVVREGAIPMYRLEPYLGTFSR